MYKWAFLYPLICFVYIYFFHYKRRRIWVAPFLITLFFPVLGFILIYFMGKEIRSNKDVIPDWLLKDEGHKEKMEMTLFKGDVERERNVIPIEDAMILNENKIKRTMLLDLLKKESIQNMEALKFALENEDTETSHYAASAIMEIKRKLLNSMQSLEQQVDENPNDIQVLSTYRDVIKQYINSGYLDENTLLKNRYAYSTILEKMIELNPNEEGYFAEKISCDLQMSEFSLAREFCDLFLKLHPNNEEAYFMDMQIYYLQKNAAGFEESLNRLRQSSVRLSPQGLSKLRFWLQGDINEL